MLGEPQIRNGSGDVGSTAVKRSFHLFLRIYKASCNKRQPAVGGQVTDYARNNARKDFYGVRIACRDLCADIILRNGVEYKKSLDTVQFQSPRPLNLRVFGCHDPCRAGIVLDKIDSGFFGGKPVNKVNMNEWQDIGFLNS